MTQIPHAQPELKQNMTATLQTQDLENLLYTATPNLYYSVELVLDTLGLYIYVGNSDLRKRIPIMVIMPAIGSINCSYVSNIQGGDP
jgi:hypothetical protein